LRVEAAHRNSSAVGNAQALQHLDGAGFSGAVRAEQAEHFALFDRKADPAHGLDFAVAFHKVFDL